MSLKNPKIDKISLKYKSSKFLGPLTEQKQTNAPSVQRSTLHHTTIKTTHNTVHIFSRAFVLFLIMM